MCSTASGKRNTRKETAGAVESREKSMIIPEDVRAVILAIYREVDAAVAAAGPVCVASGRCCRFKEYGHVLFLSNLEAAVLLASAPPYEQPVTADFCPFQKG